MNWEPSEDVCKILFHFSKICLIILFVKEVHLLRTKTLLDAVRTNARNIIGRDSMVIPLLANQELTRMFIERTFKAERPGT